MPGLYVMIANSSGVVIHIVHDFRCHVGYLRINIVVIVAGGLSLEDVAIFKQYHLVAVHLSLRLYV